MAMSFNEDIKSEIKALGIKHYELAYAIGIYRGTLTEWLRVPLTDERRERICKAIQELKKRTPNN